MEEIGATNPKYVPAIASLMASVRAPTLEKPSTGTHSLVYKTSSTFIVSTTINLRFFAIDHTAFPQVPYKLPSCINNIFTCASFYFFVCFFHFHCTLFRVLAGACVNPGSFSKHSFCAFIYLYNNSLIS